MIRVVVPTSDVNSEHGVVVHWFVEDRQPVRAGELLVEVETSKAVLEVTAPEDGILLHAVPKGRELPLTEPVALLFPDLVALESHVAAAVTAESTVEVRATVKAIQRAQELGIDLSTLDVGDRLITVKDVEATVAVPVDLPSPLDAPAGVQRIVLIGAGLGATQVIDILADRPEQYAVAIVDDSRDKWASTVAGVPVIGGADRLAPLYKEGLFDAVIIAISTSVAARRRLREECEAAGIPLANAIDRTVKIASDVELGTGNVICAFCHLGTGTRVGDNNFLSAYNSFDHHSRLGSDISTGPGCVGSGLVTLGNGVRLGTGIFIEPKVELGDNVQVASGAIILRSVPADHTVKTKVVTTAVVPQRR